MPLVNTEVQTDACDVELLIADKSGDLRGYKTIQTDVTNRTYITKNNKEVWMTKGIKKCLCLLMFLTLFGSVCVVYLGFYCPDSVCALSAASKHRYFLLKNGINKFHLNTDLIGQPLGDSARKETGPSYDEVISKDFLFNIEGHDVIVFLHIQKTGGTTFGKHLVRDLDLDRECQCHRKIKKRCTCLRPGPHSKETWLFSRYSTGWKCGLHADWTELTNCVDEMMDEIDNVQIKRRYFYITFLRNPIHRYLSEYRHVRRGATWKTSRLMCQGRVATQDEVPPCYTTETWENATLDDFISCDDNLAVNRQTRMLADLSLVGCYNKSLMSTTERDSALLLSAKNNLKHMAFFGLTEEQEKSQYLFEETFNFKFSVRFEQYNQTIGDAVLHNIDKNVMNLIHEANYLDMQLYDYARDLLHQRYRTLSSMDKQFKEHFSSMGNVKFSWEDIEKES